MTKVVCIDGTSNHTGTTVVGNVSGTLTAGSNSFVSIGSVAVMVEDGNMDIPTHQYVLIPPLFHSHTFTPDTLGQGFVTIEGKKMCLLGDSYSGNATDIDSMGSNTFVDI